MGHCIHGWKRPPNDAFEFEGKQIEMKCPYCKAEERQRKDKLEQKQQVDFNFIKSNLLYLLEHDEEFRQQVIALLK
jgi:hypothetical protein